MKKKILLFTAVLAASGILGCSQRQSVKNTASSGKRPTIVKDNPVAFARLTQGYWQIWTMQPDGSQAKQITYSSSDKRYPVWAKGNKELLFRTNDGHVFSITLADGQEKQILPSFGLCEQATPSPDGGQLLVVRLRTQLKDSGNIWLTTVGGENGKMLTHEAGIQYDPAWSPDGRKIAYISSHGRRTSEIYIMDANGTNIKRLTNNTDIDVLPVFSPDGNSIAWASDVTGDFEIWSMDADGNHAAQLTHSPDADTRPCWSPDGKQIMFASNRSGQLQLWIMDKDGSNVRQLTDSSPSMDTAWRGN